MHPRMLPIGCAEAIITCDEDSRWRKFEKDELKPVWIRLEKEFKLC